MWSLNDQVLSKDLNLNLPEVSILIIILPYTSQVYRKAEETEVYVQAKSKKKRERNKNKENSTGAAEGVSAPLPSASTSSYKTTESKEVILPSVPKSIVNGAEPPRRVNFFSFCLQSHKRLCKFVFRRPESVCINVCVCLSLTSDSSEIVEVLIIKLGTVTATDMRMDHVFIILALTFIQGRLFQKLFQQSPSSLLWR